MHKRAKHFYDFGECRVDSAERLLLRAGEAIRLSPKLFDTLLLLLENRGHLVSKDEFMQRLWPDTFVEEDTLAQNISQLRRALGERPDGQQYIQTVPKLGYRFIGKVQEITEPGQNAAAPAHEMLGPGAPTRPASRFGLDRWGVWVVAGGIGLLAGFVTFWLLSPPRDPKVLRLTQITNSGRTDPWARIVSDGARLYFLEREGDHWNLVQTSVTGGESQAVAAPFRNTLLLDISPDRTDFLIASFTARETLMPLWIWPAQGGAPRRVGDVEAYDAAWFPDGRQILYAKKDGICVVERDGTNSRRLVTTDGAPGRFAWSPDGQLLRFSVSYREPPSSAMWEINADGTHLHRLLAGWTTPPDECCGMWTPDGKHFVFQSAHGGNTNIWVLEEKVGLFRKKRKDPIRLTAGPNDFGSPLTSGDSRRLYAYERNARSELVRYDPVSHEVVPLIPSVLGWEAAYSRDGKWIAYSAGSILWRSQSDGNRRLALTSPPLEAGGPRWSPDDMQIAFVGRTPGKTSKIYVVPAEGGSPTELFPEEHEQSSPSWSPDGKSIAFARREDASGRSSAGIAIQVFNLVTKQLSFLPGSEGMFAPSWSPDGRFIAAVTHDQHKLMLFGFRGQKWTELARGTLIHGGLAWSRDTKVLYFQDLLEANEPVYRLRLVERKREQVATFETFLRAGVSRCGFLGLAPGDFLMMALLRNDADIYALDLDPP